jgi:hypothetical protein
MDDAATGRHPLNVARTDRAMVTQAVGMIDRSCQNVSDRLDSAVWMPGKPGEVIRGNVIPEVVKKEEWVKFIRASKAERAPQMYTRTL